MALYGYARVSTVDQDCTLQEHALRAAGCEQGDRILSCSGEHRQQVVFIETT